MVLVCLQQLQSPKQRKMIEFFSSNRLPAPLDGRLRMFSPFLPRKNFMSVHYVYFLGTILLSSTIFWATAQPYKSIDFVDCLFMAASAMTETGLSTIAMSQLSTGQQIILFVLMIVGSPIFISYFVVLVRKRAFETRFTKAVQTHEARSRRDTRGNLEGVPRLIIEPYESISFSERSKDLLHKVEVQQEGSGYTAGPSTSGKQNTGLLLFKDFRKRPTFLRAGSSSLMTIFRRSRAIEIDIVEREMATMNELPPDSIQLSNGNKALQTCNGSKSSTLALQDRMKLGGSEYGAIRLLAYLVPAYFVIFQVFGCLSTALYIAYNDGDIAWSNSTNPWFVSESAIRHLH
jgi:hypothetical protein